MKLNKTILASALTLSIGSAAFHTQIASAATATADALQIVILQISASKDSDLDFGTGAQNTASKSVAPGSAENAENASFTISGEANTAYTITLPANGTIQMTTNIGTTADEQINVNSFSSTPAAGANGLLNGFGSQSLFVGATRDALLAAQVPGSYSGTFTVEVVY